MTESQEKLAREAAADKLLSAMQKRHSKFNSYWANHHLREGILEGIEIGESLGFKRGLEEALNICKVSCAYDCDDSNEKIRDLAKKET